MKRSLECTAVPKKAHCVPFVKKKQPKSHKSFALKDLRYCPRRRSSPRGVTEYRHLDLPHGKPAGKLEILSAVMPPVSEHWFPAPPWKHRYFVMQRNVADSDE